MLEELSKAAQAIATDVVPSVVGIGRGRRRGSGIIVARGRILTNAHNVDPDGVKVRTHDGTAIGGVVAGMDVDGDLAVVDADVGPSAITFSEAVVEIGMPVFAVGAGYPGARVTFGLISAVGQAFRGPRGRLIRGSIEHTAPMAPGSSGSALVDVEGGLVGLNTNRLGAGFYQALPTDAVLRARIDRLAAGEDLERPRLGIAIAPSWVAQRMRAAVGLPPRDGLLVREVEADERAAKAGIAVGDLLIGVAGRELSDPDDLDAAIQSADWPLTLRLVRGQEEMDVSIPLDT